MRHSAQEKLSILRKVLRDKKAVSQACREAGISRKTFYQWKKAYSSAASRSKRKALELQYKKGMVHPRSKGERLEKRILSVVVCRPEWGSRKISQALQKGGIKLSNHAVYEILKKLVLTTREKRLEYSLLHQALRKVTKVYQKKPLRFLPEERKRMIEMVLLNKERVGDVCQRLYISRKTFYKWKKRYLAAAEKKKTLLESMKDEYLAGEAHPRTTSEGIKERVLKIVIEHPEYSTHKIANTLEEIGNHGVQNLFQRLGLNNYHLRLTYSQSATQQKTGSKFRPRQGE